MALARERWTARGGVDIDELAAKCRDIALPLRSASDLDSLIERIGDARFVLLGEASHGTSDYYAWRHRISQRLIEEKGFNFIAVEGDWPDCYRVNEYVKGRSDAGESARDVLQTYERWPTWMWANEEIVALADWLREHNRDLPDERKAGFYGLDVYSLWDSMDAVLRFLEKNDGQAVDAAKRAFQCFEPFGQDEQEYARATVGWVPTTCEDEVVAMLRTLRSAMPSMTQAGREDQFV